MLTALGFLSGGTDSYATGINNSGQIVGWGFTANRTHVVLDINGYFAP